MTWVSAAPGVDGDQLQRPVEARAEALGQQVVGLPGGGAGRVVALVGEPSRSEKNGRAISTMTTQGARRPGATGRRWINPAHRGQKPLVPVPTIRGPLVASSRFWRRLSTWGPMKPRKAAAG